MFWKVKVKSLFETQYNDSASSFILDRWDTPQHVLTDDAEDTETSEIWPGKLILTNVIIRMLITL